ncbi:glycoside hydrolase superfamily [Vararia minispora EC-137]|uniref:Glycoside hydrolase superfamily n=1 Tax=Vararia minispora EC-137 TaxID=1314806 RepID=A0ACB8QXL7_9AGAM|nr:glycoside hydrolase superfamily [Vararia minispora EC-137]
MAASRFLKQTAMLIAALLAVAAVADATQVMRRPTTYKNSPKQPVAAPATTTAQTITKRATGKVSAAYFTNWGIYGANFQPTDINPSPLTHILYAFADASASTGTVVLTDSYADEQKHFPGDSWSEPGNNLYGCLKQLYLLKLANRNLKVLLSVGGWTYTNTDGHFNSIGSASWRSAFVSSAVQLVKDYGFDGIDIDFEYPATAGQGQGFADLLTELRSSLDSLASSNGDTVPYQITAAVAAGLSNAVYYNVPQMDKAISYWNLMAYDYAGSWLTWADNQANVYGGARTGVSTDKAIIWYLANGATASKINMGMPLYGRAFESTTGLGAPYNGIGPGTIQAGIYSYKVLPLAGAQVFENTTDISSYSYDSSSKELVSYDTPNIIKLKAQYAQSKGLAGSMFWELSTDRSDSLSLVTTSANVYGALDTTQNHINYPNSKWDNIRSNMGQGSSGGGSTTTVLPTTTTVPPTTTTSTTTTAPSTTTTTNPGSGVCSGIAAWSSSVAYTGGSSVTYNGHLWTASWWTEADTPGGAAGVWVDKGAC